MRTYPYFDAHCDTLYRCELEGWDIWENPGHVDLKRLSAFEPMGQVFALWTNSAGKTSEECWKTLCAQVEPYFSARTKNPELLKNCCLSIEGAELFGCDTERLPMLKEWGVRWINLTHNQINELGFPHTTDKGLTEKGKAFAKRAKELGIYIDVAHLSERGFWDLMETIDGPIVDSHCNSRDLMNHTRNIWDNQAKEIIARKGFIGMSLYHGFIGENPTVDDLVRHVEHFLELGAEDCLGLGGDLDGADLLLEDIPVVENVPKLWEALYRRNYSEELVYKLAYGNLDEFLKRPAGKL